ncbi:hypothetical protein [Enterobacter kobei]|uniref:hypothetical protein n=1 Tax=Enterobacter kobei TaxID=208224 RepID=UPI0028762E19|nr:hypothetical protein [Enterobacter kobei]MDS0026497.1 hypothetical protein [Enterobacter kobei]
MEAVYTLLGIERGVPEVFNSTYDIAPLLDALHQLRDGEEVARCRARRSCRDRVLARLDRTGSVRCSTTPACWREDT